jgi:hypothetical protein
MKRAMAKQAEAEREKRAKIINAEGESLAAAALGDASDTMMAHPSSYPPPTRSLGFRARRTRRHGRVCPGRPGQAALRWGSGAVGSGGPE